MPGAAPNPFQATPTTSYTSRDFTSVSYTINPLAGLTMARRCTVVMRGASKPLVVLDTSSRAVGFGGSPPMPSDPVVNTASDSSSVKGLTPAGPCGPSTPMGPCDPVAPVDPEAPAAPAAPCSAITLQASLLLSGVGLFG